MIKLAQKALFDFKDLQESSVEVSSSSVTLIERLGKHLNQLKAQFLADIVTEDVSPHTLSAIDEFKKVRQKVADLTAGFIDTFERTTDDSLLDKSDEESQGALSIVDRTISAYGLAQEAAKKEEGGIGVKGFVVKAIRGIAGIAATAFRVLVSGVKVIAKILSRVLLSPWGLALIAGAAIVTGAVWLYKKFTGGKSSESAESESGSSWFSSGHITPSESERSNYRPYSMVTPSRPVSTGHQNATITPGTTYRPSSSRYSGYSGYSGYSKQPVTGNYRPSSSYSRQPKGGSYREPTSSRYLGSIDDEKYQSVGRVASTMPSFGLGNPSELSVRQDIQQNISRGTGRAYAKKLANRSIMDAVIEGANRVGVDPQMMLQIVRAESAYGTMTVSGTSQAQGIFQIIPSTWQSHYRQFDKKYGIPRNTPNDPLSASIFSAAYAKDVLIPRVKKVKPDATAADLYMLYVFGPGGGIALLKDYMKNPNQYTVYTHSRRSYGPSQIRANRSYFYNKDGSAKTVAETYRLAQERVTMSVEEEEVMVEMYGSQILAQTNQTELVTYAGRVYQV